MDINKLYQIYKQSTGVCTDTRRLKEGQLFFALKGDNFNGNKFAGKALEQGAICAVIDQAEYKTSDKTILVDDGLKTLQKLATHHRKQLNIPFIAITGSNGKTTTKELVAACLSKAFKTSYTKGNLNNHIGVPLTILSIDDNIQMAVIEMGANHPIEINQLCKIALPNYGLITNIGKAHLEGFGTIDGVQKAKGELFEFLESAGGHCFVNANDFRVVELAYFINNVSSYGNKKVNTVYVEAINNESKFLKVRWHWKDKLRKTIEIYDIQTQLTGNYNLDNVSAAIAVANKFKVSPEKIKQAIEGYQPQNSRSQLVINNNYQIILDAYNANPSSTEQAIKNLASYKGEKIAVLGDMLELGKYSLEEHQKIVELLIDKKIDKVILIGKEYGACKVPNLFKTFENVEAAKSYWQQLNKNSATILLKGSRSIGVEKLL